jgi:RimJ/RimL family protein N-acetyltransferase
MPDQVDVRSARLSLEPLMASDADAVARIFASPETSRYLGVDFSRKGNFNSMMERRLTYTGAVGTGHWLIRTTSGTPVGLAHLRDSWELPGGVPEMGWYLDPDHIGQGYAAEAAVALLRHGTRDLGMPTIWALIHVDNDPSRVVAERAGFLFGGCGTYYSAPHNVFRYDAEPLPTMAGTLLG